MALSGITAIDRLMADPAAPPLAAEASPDPEAVSAIQDLLIGHGFHRLPGLVGAGRGKFGPQTKAAVQEFRRGAGQTIDAATLHRMVEEPATSPVAGRAYLTLALDLVFTGMTRLMSVTAQFEGQGSFTAANLGELDHAGMSFGLIQWAQKPKRLHELLRAFQAEAPQLFVEIFGAGDPARAQGLLAHTTRPNGGLDATGETTDAAFALTRSPWVERFVRAGQDQTLQRVQVRTALDAFQSSFRKVEGFAPDVRSERGVAFLLDVANQHGDTGAKSIFETIRRAGMSEAELLRATQQESVERVRRQFGEGNVVRSTENRREMFRATPLLSDEVFLP